jgi:hypothetical protein
VAGSTGGDGERAGPGASGVRPTPPTDATAGRVVVVGSLNLDHTVRVARLPEAGATVSGHEYATAAGGKGLNQAVAAARQGAAVVMIGAVGDDAAGGLLAGVLADERIGTGGLRRVPGPSGTALITVSEDGDNTIVVAPGANGALTPGDVTAASMAGAAVVLCQLEVPMEVVLAALHAGRAAGALTVLNPAPATGPLDPSSPSGPTAPSCCGTACRCTCRPCRSTPSIRPPPAMLSWGRWSPPWPKGRRSTGPPVGVRSPEHWRRHAPAQCRACRTVSTSIASSPGPTRRPPVRSAPPGRDLDLGP